MDAKEQARRIHEQFDRNAEVAAFHAVPNNGVQSPAARALLEDGFVILKDVLTKAELDAVRAAFEGELAARSHTGRNRFEGRRTQRMYGVLGKSRAFDRLCELPAVLELCDAVLQPNFLITAGQCIRIDPGEEHQPYHFDDAFCLRPRPRKPFSVASIFAIDDFTPSNGATLIFPRSHLWPEGRVPGPNDRPVPCVMPAGSVVVFLSTLWHGGGPNTTSNMSRLAVTFQYCEPFIRPQENQFLVVPHEVLPRLSPKLVSMLGYSIHPPFIGHVDGKHPLKALRAKL